MMGFYNNYKLGGGAFRFLHCKNRKGGETCQKELKSFGIG